VSIQVNPEELGKQRNNREQEEENTPLDMSRNLVAFFLLMAVICVSK